MENTLPDCLSSLALVLENRFGFSKTEDTIYESFGNRVIVFELNRFRLRFNRDRGIWSIELSEAEAPANWYYTSLIREAVDGTSADSHLNIDKESEYWRTHWPVVQSLFDTKRESVHQLINRVAMNISKRQNPSWYK